MTDVEGGVETAPGVADNFLAGTGASSNEDSVPRPHFHRQDISKMPLGPPSSAVFLQNAAPGFTSTPGYAYAILSPWTSINRRCAIR